MRLYVNAMSPYGRKVLVTIHHHGLTDKVEIIDVNPRTNPEAVIPVHPMGKIPVLIMDDGIAIRDSPVIAEYLDAEYGKHGLLPPTGADRWNILTRMADADGVIEAAVLVRNERLRPGANQSEDFINWHLGKIGRCLDHFETLVGDMEDRFDLGAIAIAAAIGYVPRRIAEYEGLTAYPVVRTFYDRMMKHSAFARTEPA